MPALLIYLLKVNIALLIFCLGYYTVLRHLTFYTLNRVYLISAILFSTLYPLINITGFVNQHQEIARPIQVVIINWQVPVQKIAVAVTHHDKWFWLQTAFWVGVIILSVRLALQLLSLYRLHRQSAPAQVQHYSIRAIKGNINPFSFWQSIYVNPENHAPQELNAILEHEQIHVNEWHTLDILLGEISTVFYWFNPGIWLIKKAIRENIEFITDRKILQQGMDCKAYQYSLVNVNFGTQNNAIVNHFNISTIKKRIMMMNAKQSSNVNLTRYMFLVPAVVALLLVFSVSKAELHKAVKSSKHLLTHIKIAAKGIDMPFKPAKAEYPKAILTDTTAKHFHAATSGKYQYLSADSSKKQRAVSITSGKKSRLNNQLSYTITNGNTDTIRKESGKIAKTDSLLNIMHEWEVHKDGTVTKNGVIVKGKVINSHSIDSVIKLMKRFEVDKDGNIIQNEHAVNKIRLNGNTFSVGGSNIDSSLKTMKGFKIDKNGLLTQNGQKISKIMLNGKTYSVGGSNVDSLQAMKGFNVDKNGSVAQNEYPVGKLKLDGMTYSMNGSTTIRSREVDKDGAVSKKEHNAPRVIMNNITLPVNFNNKLIIIDGKEATTKDLKKLSLDKIETINSLPRIISLGNRDTSLAKYGDKGKNGVIIITTKK